MRKSQARFYLGFAALISLLGLVLMSPMILAGKLATVGLALFFGAPGWAALLMQYQNIRMAEVDQTLQPVATVPEELQPTPPEPMAPTASAPPPARERSEVSILPEVSSRRSRPASKPPEPMPPTSSEQPYVRATPARAVGLSEAAARTVRRAVAWTIRGVAALLVFAVARPWLSSGPDSPGFWIRGLMTGIVLLAAAGLWAITAEPRD